MSWKSILKAKKVEKDTNPYNWFISQWETLMREAKGAAGSGLGVSPKSTTNLWRMMMKHGIARRKGTSGGKVAIRGAEVFKQIGFAIQQSGGNLDEESSKKILKWLKILERMESNPTSNPQNIPFMHPKSTKKVAGGGRVKSKQKVTWFGHPYNSHYNKIQEEVEKETLPAIPTDWASDSRDTAKPPLWQGFFSGGSRGVSGKQIVTKGLLTILEEYRDHLKKEVKE